MAKSAHQVLHVQKVIREGSAGVSLIFDRAIPARPGQFVMAWLPDVAERPFSLMDDQPFSLTVADVGPLTHALCTLRVGDGLWIRGPYGHGFELDGRRHLLVGGGSGAASLALLAKVARHRGDKVITALGARTADQLMLHWRFRALGCNLIVTTDDGTMGYTGSALDVLNEQLANRSIDIIYGCGPEPMLRALAQYAEERDIPCQVSMEAVMKCGFGVCGACHRGDRLVCKDGPVFSGQMLLHQL